MKTGGLQLSYQADGSLFKLSDQILERGQRCCACTCQRHGLSHLSYKEEDLFSFAPLTVWSILAKAMNQA